MWLKWRLDSLWTQIMFYKYDYNDCAEWDSPDAQCVKWLKDLVQLVTVIISPVHSARN